MIAGRWKANGAGGKRRSTHCCYSPTTPMGPITGHYVIYHFCNKPTPPNEVLLNLHRKTIIFYWFFKFFIQKFYFSAKNGTRFFGKKFYIVYLFVGVEIVENIGGYVRQRSAGRFAGNHRFYVNNYVENVENVVKWNGGVGARGAPPLPPAPPPHWMSTSRPHCLHIVDFRGECHAG